MPSLYHFNSDQFKENLMLGGQQHMVAGRLCQYLKGWQLDGIRFLYKHFEKGEACILNDESGLGKAVTVSVFLGAILSNDTTKKCLIIVRDDEYIEGWRFHLSVLTQLSVKVIERTSDINYETVFLIKWSTLKNIGQITKTAFDHVIIDNRGEMMTNKFCTGILLRYFENKTSIIISSVDVTANIKLLHILLRLCGHLDKQYTDLKTFEDKFQLPALKDGVLNKVDLEDYFLKREKVINFCREFRLRRYCHQFDEQFPLVPCSEFKRHLEQWRNGDNSQNSGSVKLLSSSSEKDIEELFQAYFQVKQERETAQNLDCEVQQITEHISEDANTEISDEVVVMSPLLFVSESESDGEEVPQTDMHIELSEEVKQENTEESVEAVEKQKICATKNRRKSNKPVKRLTRSTDESLHRKNLRSRSVRSDEILSPARRKSKKHKADKVIERNVNSSKNGEDRVISKRLKNKDQDREVRKENGGDRSHRKACRDTGIKEQDDKVRKPKLNENGKVNKDAETLRAGVKRKSHKVDESKEQNLKTKPSKSCEGGAAKDEIKTRLQCDQDEGKTNKDAEEEEAVRTLRAKLVEHKTAEKMEGLRNQHQLGDKSPKSKNQAEAKLYKEEVNKRIRRALRKAATHTDEKSEKVETPRSRGTNEGLKKVETPITKKDSTPKSTASNSGSKKEEALKSAATKSSKEDSPRSAKNTTRHCQLDLVLSEAKKFLNIKGNSSRRTTESDLTKAPRRINTADNLSTPKSTIKVTPRSKPMASPRKPLEVTITSRKGLNNRWQKVDTPRRAKPLTVYTPLGVHSRSTRGMDRYTRSSATQNKYMKVSVAQVEVERVKHRRRSVAPKEIRPPIAKSATPPPPAPLPAPAPIQESPAILESMQLGQALTPTNGPLLNDFIAPPPKNSGYNFPLMLDKEIPESECLITSQNNNKNEVIILTGSSTNDNEMEPPKSTVSRRKATTKPPMVTIPRPMYAKAQSPDLFSTCSDLSLPCSQQLNSKSNFDGFKIFGSEVQQPIKVRSCLDILDRIDNWSGTASTKKTNATPEKQPALSQQHNMEDEDTMFEITSNGTFGNIIRVNSNGEMSPVRNKNQQTASHPRNRITNYLISSNQHASSASPCPSSEDTTDALQKTPKRRKSLSGTVKRSPRGINGGKSQSTKLTKWLVNNNALATKRRRLDLLFPNE